MDGSKVQAPLQKYFSANREHKTDSAIDYLKISRQRKTAEQGNLRNIKVNLNKIIESS